MFMVTVVSFSLIGSTYAKFVSRVSARGGSKSAGFLVSSTNSSSDLNLTAKALIMPSQSKNIEISFTYYSQVLTQFKTNSESIKITGTGALEVGIYKLLEEYRETWLPAHSKNYLDNETQSPTSFEEMFSLTFSGLNTMAEECALAVGKASKNTLSVTGTVVEAMPESSTQSLSCSITATLTWEEISNAWDTFIGNKVYEYMQTNSGKRTGIILNIGVTAEQCFSVLVEGITSIPNGYFQNRKDIKEVEIPNTVKTIGSNAFQNCTNLETVIIPEGVTTIGPSAFSGCQSLDKIEIPETVTNIGASAFLNCTSLKEVTIPSSVKTIGNNTFQGCTNLESVTISEGVTAIYSNAFEGCSSLTEIEIPSTVTTLGAFAFLNASGLAKVTLSADAIASIGAGPFAGSNAIEYNIYDNGLYLGNETNPYIMLVKSVNRDISSIEINENCKLIAGRALMWCRQLTSIDIPEGVKTIGDYAFWYCGYVSINLPSTLENIGSRAFLNCDKLEEINVNEGNPKFASFGSCIYEKATKALVVAAGPNAVIPSDGSVTTILKDSICANNKILIIPATITSIQEYALLGVTDQGITNSRLEVEVDAGNANYFVSGGCLIERSSGTVLYASNYPEVPKDGSVKRFAIYSFRYVNMTEIYIPKSLDFISTGAIAGCSNLNTIKFEGTSEEWKAKSYSTQDWVKGKNIIFNA